MIQILSDYVAGEWWADRGAGKQVEDGSQEWEDRVTWAAMGASEEAGEVAGEVLENRADKVLAEAGDVVHYLLALSRLTGYMLPDPPELFSPTGTKAQAGTAALKLCRDCSELLGSVKKARFYKKDPADPLFSTQKQRFEAAMDSAWWQLDEVLRLYGTNLSVAAAHNYAKMMKRFPNGWNPADAVAKKDEAK
jgi:hypothetical protein